jgi:DNA mismatch repair protein MutL
MSLIRILPPELRNKIAAGEVIERPASVVKELLENSIDAGCTRITVETSRAGKRLIKVLDNGSGMDREDAVLAFEPHGTSKLQSEEDLFRITTMGFRGEALASIASVAKVRIMTALKGSVGTCLEFNNGRINNIQDCPATGTTIEARDLFYNTPARLKFLKSDTTENYHITDTVTRAALSHFNIGFTLVMDGYQVFDLYPAVSYRERIIHLFGPEFVQELLEKESREQSLGLHLFLGRPEEARNSRSQQFLFINSRPIRDPSIGHAIYQAYDLSLARDKHPVFFLFLNLDPSAVDVNVHPTKREVRFSNKNLVYHFVGQAVRESLRDLLPNHDELLLDSQLSQDLSTTLIHLGITSAAILVLHFRQA